MSLERAREGWAKALEGHPFVSVEQLFAELAEDKAQWWRGESSDVFTRLYSNGVLEMGPVAGDVGEMVEVMLPKIEAWAGAAGAHDVLLQAGRIGWERVLKDKGYEVVAVIMRKKLSDGPFVK